MTPPNDASRKLKPFGERAGRFAYRWPGHDAWINILVGSVRSAKTWATIPKINALCHYEVDGLRLIAGKSKQSIYDNVLNDLFDFVEPGSYAYNRQSGELWLYDTKWIVIGAKDAGSEQYLRGKTVGIAVYDELTLSPRSFFMQLLARMSPKGARFYGTTNCDSPHHWLKTEVIENANYSRGLGKDIWVQTWTMDDNPNLDPGYIERTKRSYTGVFFQRFILGRWVLAEGAIYRDCLTDANYYDDSSRPPGLPSRGGHVEHWVSIDYGTTNPMVFGDIYDDGKTLWLDREYYWDSKKENRQKTDAQYADDLIQFFKDGGATDDKRTWPGVILDPSAASFRAEIVSRGIHVIDADNTVEDGIRRVSSMLNQKKIRINKPRCPNVVRELETYSWDDKKAENGKEQPLKRHDHGPDMLRYEVQTRINDWRVAA